MKIRTLLVICIAAIFAMPAVACGPGMTQPSGGGGGQVHGRKKAVKRRMGELKPKIDEYEHAQRAANGIDEFLHGIDGKAGSVAIDEAHRHMPRAILVRKPQSPEERLYMFRRFEYLALKKERKGLSGGEAAEMYALRSVLANSGGSGR